MLRLARVKLEAAGIASSLRQGDMYALPLRRRQRRQRHHPPGAALCPFAGRRDRRGGARARAGRDACWSSISPPTSARNCAPTDAHIRLGFDDEAMAGWFAAAGLERRPVQHLKGGELTVTLWRGVKAAVRAAEGGMNALRPARAAISRCSPKRAATSRSASNSSRPRPRRWPRPCGARSRRSRRCSRASSRSPTAPAARPASAPTRPSSGSSRKRR